jgi:ankyrin repeat protein
MQAPQEVTSPNSLATIPKDILFLIVWHLLEIDDPIYLVLLMKVARRFRQLLSGEDGKVFWQFRLKNDFPSSYAEEIDSKEVYKEQWQVRKKNKNLSAFHQDFFNSIRKGNLAKIQSVPYCPGNQGLSAENRNDFMDIGDAFGENALIQTSRYERKEIQNFIYRYMVEKYFQICESGKDIRGRTQLHWAAACGMVTEIQRLNTIAVDEKSQSGTPLLLACTYNQLGAVKALVARGANVNFEHNTVTPLIRAASSSCLEIVNVLIVAGAQVDKTYNNGITALFDAVTSRKVAVVKTLLAAGANPNHANRAGATPIFYASTKEICDVLVAAKADIHHKEQYGVTPIFWAAMQGRTEVINCLVALGALVNQAKANGVTPVFEAVLHRHVHAVRALIAAGANIDKALNKSENLLCVAAKAGHYVLCKILLAAGADFNINKEDLKPEIKNLLRLWELKVANKDKSLCEQILVILGVSLEWTTLVTSFFSKPEIINILTSQKNNPELNNNVEHLMTSLRQYQQQIPVVNFEFITDFILPKERKQERPAEEMGAVKDAVNLKK